MRMNALQGSLMRFQRCSATVKKSRCIIRKKTNLLQRNAETMTLSQVLTDWYLVKVYENGLY